MTSQHTPTRTPVGQAEAGSATAFRQQRSPAPRPRGSWVVWAGIAVAYVLAVWLVGASVATDVDPVPSARANQAATDRLQGLADQYEAVRTSRANRAATARLQGLADQYEGMRVARANRAATARLQELADRDG